ncbi:hypothetical protein E4633_06525 [Geomonas terrae]|uniref:Uncharacterized protein n=1 Tax=Geomonas terrae TaxID=2562681 RepID=A0A4S1CN74_9BACT|nr:hypothetical protein [Geomonas terrae]TGU75103.1 hypothetical protein E4633_06525 [Geomonas terrae]
MTLQSRVHRLELQSIQDIPPLPGLVRVANTPEEEEAAERELETMPRGTQLYIIKAVDCSRKGEL